MDDSRGNQSVKRTFAEIVSVSPNALPEIDVQNNSVPFGRFSEILGKYPDGLLERFGFLRDIVPSCSCVLHIVVYARRN